MSLMGEDVRGVLQFHDHFTEGMRVRSICQSLHRGSFEQHWEEQLDYSEVDQTFEETLTSQFAATKIH